MAYLIDTRPFTSYKILTESRGGSEKFLVEGLMQVADDENGNGRIYPRDILEREVQKFKDVYIANKNPYGELDHPESPIVSMKNVSHAIVDLWWEGNNVMGRIEVLNTPTGNIVKEVLKAGYVIGISSRGTGSTTEENGRVVVNDDFDLVTWDFVSNPSVQGAFLRQVGNLSEGLKPQETQRYAKLNSILNDLLRD